MHKFLKGKGLAILLTLAMMIVAVAVIVPIATAADPAEIQDFQYQTLSALNLAGDADTDLRFVFTVGKLDYTEVGFVVSKSNSTPTIGGANCYKAGTTTVYSTITADSTQIPAPAGRFWVAIKLTDIPHAYFDGSLYVRAFVTDGEGTRYSDVSGFTVCAAAGHTHTIDEFEHQRTGGTAALDVAGTIIGNCPGCNLEVTFNDVKAGVENQHWIGGSGQARMYDRRQISDILRGGKHFYPDASNGGLGNDLVIEYSILWNETLLNLSPTYSDGARVLTTFDTANSGFSGDYRAIAYASLTNDVANSGANFAGAFEYPSELIQTSEPSDPHPGMTAGGGAYSAYANLGGTDRDHPEWGWHRVGVVYHEDVTNLNAVKGGATATYKLTVTIYIDGEVVSILSGTHLDRNTADYKLFTATHDGNGGVTYEDIDEDIWVFAFLVPYVTATSADAWFADGDVFVTAGHDFVHPVTRIDNPAARTETVDGHDFNGAFYYPSAGAHDHVWGSLVNDASHTADCGHAATQSIHCTICGAVKPDSTVNLPIDPSLHAYGDWEQILAPTLVTNGRERRTCTNCGGYDYRDTAYAAPTEVKYTTSNSSETTEKGQLSALLAGGKHFYPDSSNDYQGNDLLIEYSLLWNNTLNKLKDDGSGVYGVITQRFSSDSGLSQNTNDLAWISLKANCGGSDCKFAGGFEYGGLRTVEVGPAKMSTTKANSNKCPGSLYGDFPNVGGVESGNVEWGWHRVQIRFHQELTNESAVKTGSAATYYLYVEVSIDGTLLFRNSNASSDIYTDTSWNADNLLFTVRNSSADGYTLVNGLYYKDNGSRYFAGLRMPAKRTSSGAAYFVYGDYECFAGQDFKQSVEKVEFPADAIYTTADGTDLNAAFYYKPTGGESEPKVYDSKNALGRDFIVTEHLTNVLDGEHFYPTAGNAGGKALYFETDFLWNETITSNYKDGDGFRFRLKNYGVESGTSPIYLFVPKNNVWGSSDAKAPGGFDYGWEATHSITYGPLGVNGTGTNAENFPNIGAYGWHKIGIKFYETATANGNSGVNYSVVSTLYIDGAKVWEITYTGDFSDWLGHGTMLFTATNDGGNLTYADPDYTLCMDFMGGGSHSSGQKYFVYDNVSWSVVAPNFAPAYSPVVSPAAATYTLPDDSEIPAAVYFQPN